MIDSSLVYLPFVPTTHRVWKLRDPEKGEKDGQYVYIVHGGDKLPFSVALDAAEFGPGTLIRDVGYEFGRKTQPLLLDIYNILMFRLFDPVLPFWIEEQRTSVENTGDRADRAVR